MNRLQKLWVRIRWRLGWVKPIILDNNPLSLACYIEEYGDLINLEEAE